MSQSAPIRSPPLSTTSAILTLEDVLNGVLKEPMLNNFQGDVSEPVQVLLMLIISPAGVFSTALPHSLPLQTLPPTDASEYALQGTGLKTQLSPASWDAGTTALPFKAMLTTSATSAWRNVPSDTLVTTPRIPV